MKEKSGRPPPSKVFLNPISLNETHHQDEERCATKIQALSGAIASKDDKQMAETFLEAVSVFEELGAAAKEVVS